MLHLLQETYYLGSSSHTGPQELILSPFDSQENLAVLLADFRESYPGGREIFKSA